MAKKIKWAERPSRVTRGVERKIELVWMKEGELAYVVNPSYSGRGTVKRLKHKVLGQGVIIKIVMPGLNGYSEVLWNGEVRTIGHIYLKPVHE